MDSRVSIVECQSYDPDLVQASVRKVVELLGGINHFIPAKSRVLVKPNLLMAKDPEFAITTHPEILRAVIRILKENDCQVVVGDSPSVWGSYIEDVEEVYQRCGIEEVCSDEGAQLVKFSKRSWHKKIPLTACLKDCQYLLNLPKLKTHHFTILSGAIKNLFGLVPGTYKTELHKNNFTAESFSRMLVDIYELTKPTLTIVDGILAMEGNGPGTSGKPRQANLLIAGGDAVAIDSILARVIGVEPLDILTTKEAARRGLGSADINSITVLGADLNEISKEQFLLPSDSLLRKKIPKPVIKIVKKFIRYYPYARKNKCIRCGACVKACPEKIITMNPALKDKGGVKKKRLYFDYSKCIACFCCQEVCPAAAIDIRRSFLAKLIGL